MPPTSRGISRWACGFKKNVFRSRAKYLIPLSTLILASVWILGVFYLPENTLMNEENSMNKIFKVYKGLQKASEDLALPKPAISDLNNVVPAVHHGILGQPDPHKAEDIARLQAQIDLNEVVRKPFMK